MTAAEKNEGVENPKKRVPSRWATIAFFVLSSICFLWTARGLSDASWEPTAGRSVMFIGAALAISCLFFLLALLFFVFRNLQASAWTWLFERSLRARSLFCLMLAIFIAGLLLLLFPSARFEPYADYHAWLYPAWGSIALTAGLASFILFFSFRGVDWSVPGEQVGFRIREAYIVSLVFSLMLVIWLVISLSGRGIQSSEDYWYGAGTPLLFQQFLAGIIVAVLFSWIEPFFVEWAGRQRKFTLSPDVILFFAIWGIAAVLWAVQATPSGFAAPRPLPPNFEIYPYADARRFDVGSQFALIGQGLNDTRFYYRIFYMGYLFVLHGLFGQDYDRLMFVQSILFAVFPSLVYLLGKSLWKRSFGVAAASVALFSGLNSIPASQLVDLANPKQMLTDYPTVIAIAGFLLLTTRWVKKPQNISYLFWAAGVLGVAALVRTSALGLMGILLGVIWILTRRMWKSRIILAGMCMVLFLAGALPWSVWLGRFVTDMYSPKIISVLYSRYIEPDHPLPPEIEVNIVPPETASTPRSSPLQALTEHFLHGLVTSTLVMPPSLFFHDLSSVVREQFPYWDSQWDGTLDTSSKVLIALNLAFLSCGIVFAIRKSGLAGGLPLTAHILYTLINSVGRTSGGRYSAPVDWIFLFYYAWGALVVVQWIGSAFSSTSRFIGGTPASPGFSPVGFKTSLRWAFPIFLFFIGISSAMILAGLSVPARYVDRPVESLVGQFTREGFYRQIPGMDETALSEFMQSEGAVLWEGRALYPRNFLASQGLGGIIGIYRPAEYPRLIFSMVGPQGQAFVVLPGVLPKYFPHAADVFVLGCRDGNYAIQALAVVLLADKTVVYTIPVSVEFNCPLQLDR